MNGEEAHFGTDARLLHSALRAMIEVKCDCSRWQAESWEMTWTHIAEAISSLERDQGSAHGLPHC
jgi:hypothetical protein